MPGSEYDNPDAWDFHVEPSGRGYLVYLRCGIIRYGLNGYGWHCLTASGAISKGRRELAKHQATLRRKAEKKALIEELRNA